MWQLTTIISGLQCNVAIGESELPFSVTALNLLRLMVQRTGVSWYGSPSRHSKRRPAPGCRSGSSRSGTAFLGAHPGRWSQLFQLSFSAADARLSALQDKLSCLIGHLWLHSSVAALADAAGARFRRLCGGAPPAVPLWSLRLARSFHESCLGQACSSLAVLHSGPGQPLSIILLAAHALCNAVDALAEQDGHAVQGWPLRQAALTASQTA